MTILRHLTELGGCGRFSELVERPGDRSELERLVACGSVRRVHRGCYAVPGVGREIIAATVFRAEVTCISAADLYDLTVLDRSDRVHLSVPRPRGTSRPGLRDCDTVVIHREAAPPGQSSPTSLLLPSSSRARGASSHLARAAPPTRDSQGVPRDNRSATGPGSARLTGKTPRLVPAPSARVAPPASALARVLQCQPGDRAVVTVDSALNRGLVTVDELRAVLPPTAPVRARLVLALVDGRSQSPAETLARLVLRQEGLRVEPQVRILGVGRVDLLVEGFVVVETDGFRYHSDRSQFREDRRRDRELAKQGWVVLRFSFEDVVRDPSRLVADVRAVLADGGRRSAPRA